MTELVKASIEGAAEVRQTGWGLKDSPELPLQGVAVWGARAIDDRGQNAKVYSREMQRTKGEMPDKLFELSCSSFSLLGDRQNVSGILAEDNPALSKHITKDLVERLNSGVLLRAQKEFWNLKTASSLEIENVMKIEENGVEMYGVAAAGYIYMAAVLSKREYIKTREAKKERQEIGAEY